MPTSFLTLNLTTDHAVPIQPGGGTATVTVTSGASVYYSSDADINSTHNEGTLVLSTPVAFTNPIWLLSAGASTVTVQLDPPGGGAAGALTLLSTITLAAPGTFDITGISSGYSDLIIVVIARGTAAAFNDNPVVKLNNDTAGNYYTQRIRGTGATASALENIGAGWFGAICQIPAASSPAGLFGVQVWTFFGYSSTAWLKTALIEESSPVNLGSGAIYVNRFSAVWNSTAAINRFSYVGSTATNLVAGSQLRIYGRT